jgi:6-phosphogluconolactonase
MIQLREFATREALMGAAAERIAKALQNGISERGEGVAALSGGGTPEPAYAELAKLKLDWPRVTFGLVDERFVPPSDAASNEALLRRTLSPALAAGAKLLQMYADCADIEKAAARADKLYSTQHIDIALMGMGSDGHTASWFPQSPQLDAALNGQRTVIAAYAPGATGSAERLTLTRRALGRASSVVLLITGDEKRRFLEDRARASLPIDRLLDLPLTPEVLWAR